MVMFKHQMNCVSHFPLPKMEMPPTMTPTMTPMMRDLLGMMTTRIRLSTVLIPKIVDLSNTL